MTSFALLSILDKTENRDKDFRYMATSDLFTELTRDTFKPDTDGERKICRCLLKLLLDPSSDVQGLAVKCFAPLVRKVHCDLVEGVMAELCDRVLHGKADERDVSAIGLKTILLDLPSAMGTSAIRKLVPKLFCGVQQDTLEVKLESLEILTELLNRFAGLLNEARLTYGVFYCIKTALENKDIPSTPT